MSIENNIQDNLAGTSIKVNNMLSSFDVRNELLDNMLDNELYNQELYNGGVGNRYVGNSSTIKGDFFDIVKTSTSFDVANIDKLETGDISNISLTYNKTADLYRNQNAVDYYVEGKKKKFETRNKELLEDVDNRIRQKEIFTFYYKKYNAQKKILFNVIIASLLTIGLTYLNRSYKFLFTDTLFILTLGIVLTYLVINICIQLIDIFFRNEVNYDEYDYMFGSGLNMNGNIQQADANEKERQNCDAEIKAYQGR